MIAQRLRTKVALSASVLALALCAGSLHAQQPAPAAPAKVVKPVKPADKPVWNQLSPAQKVALAPLQTEWDAMEGVRKQKWLVVANRYATMKPEEQQRVHERMREWIRLTPAQRSAVRQNFSQARTLAPDEKSATWESYKQLPDEQKQKLAEQAARKQVTNLPTAKAAPRGPAPVLHSALACPAGTVKNTASAVPACVAAAPAVATGLGASTAPVK